MIGESVRDFDFALYGQIRRQPGNSILSPFSVRIALALALAGARGETAAQIREALGGASDGDAIHEELAAIIRRLNAAGGGAYQLAVANSLWAQQGTPLLDEFLGLIARCYGGGLNLADFLRDAEGARQEINDWVRARTKNRIRDVIPPSGIHPDTRLVLANAIHFKGKWRDPFFTYDTRDREFHLENGGTVKVPFMHRQGFCRYHRGDGLQSVELMYLGDEISMLLLLPNDRNGLPGLERGLSTRLLRDCEGHLHEENVVLAIPRFKASRSTELLETLHALGMTSLFDRSLADFSGINGLRPPHEEALSVGAVFHKAFVETNEKGTEAAAATAVAIRAKCAAPAEGQVPVFLADHPFIFAIRERKSGAVLFVGRVCDPSNVE